MWRNLQPIPAELPELPLFFYMHFQSLYIEGTLGEPNDIPTLHYKWKREAKKRKKTIRTSKLEPNCTGTTSYPISTFTSQTRIFLTLFVHYALRPSRSPGFPLLDMTLRDHSVCGFREQQASETSPPHNGTRFPLRILALMSDISMSHQDLKNKQNEHH